MTAMRAGFKVLSAVAPGLAARAAARIWFTHPRPKIREEARAFLATGQRFELTVNGRRVAAWRWGSGPAVLLVHGWGGFAAQMQPFVEPLVRAGYQPIAFDAPAHGESGPSRFGTHRTTLFDFTDTMRVLTRDTTPVAGLVAHSGACAGAAWLALTSPEWKAPPMAFIAPWGSPSIYMKKFQRAIGASDEVMRRFSENAERELHFRWVDLEVPAMAGRMRTPPLLVVHDRDDRETTWAEGKAIADAWPGAQLVTTTGLGHRRIVRDPGVVDAVVRFIATRSSSAP